MLLVSASDGRLHKNDPTMTESVHPLCYYINHPGSVMYMLIRRPMMGLMSDPSLGHSSDPGQAEPWMYEFSDTPYILVTVSTI